MTDSNDFDTGERSFAANARRRAIEAYDGARQSVTGARRRAADQLDEAPLVALAGGLAAGALIAALIPRTRTETQLLRPVGDRVRTGARAAVGAAKDAGTSRLADLGLTRENGADALRSIFQSATEAARSSLGGAKSSRG